MIIEEMAAYIDDKGLGTYSPDSAGGNIFLEEMPPAPDDAICVYSTGGSPGDAGTSIRRPSAQIIVRGVDLAETMVRASAIHALFNDSSIREFTPGGTRVMLCQCRQSEASHIGTDENGRHEYTINVATITGGD